MSSTILGLVIAVDIGLGYWQITQGPRRGTSESVHLRHPLLGWIPSPSASGNHTRPGNFSVQYNIDEMGFRSLPRCPNPRQRVLFYGDSYTFGHGVEDYETFSWLLAENYLSPEVRVINAGVNGYGITQMRARFEADLNLIQPNDIVVFSPITTDLLRDLVDFADLSPRIIEDDFGNFPLYRDGEIIATDVHTSRNYALGLIFNARFLGKAFQKLHRVVWRPSSIADSKSMMLEAKAMTEARGAKFVLVFLPRIKELIRGRWLSDTSSMKFHDIRSQFPSAEEKLMSFRFETDSHYNSAGHAHVARILGKILISMGVAPRDKHETTKCPPA